MTKISANVLEAVGNTPLRPVFNHITAGIPATLISYLARCFFSGTMEPGALSPSEARA